MIADENDNRFAKLSGPGRRAVEARHWLGIVLFTLCFLSFDSAQDDNQDDKSNNAVELLIVAQYDKSKYLRNDKNHKYN